MFKDRESFPVGINHYVPGMQLADGATLHAPQAYNLGKPAAASATAVATLIAANAANGTIAAITWKSDARYGRMLNYTPSAVPGNNNVVDVYGTDYLGQPMVERFTGAAAASTAVLGKKAFFRVTHTKIVLAATNAITFSIGTQTGLGLPYKGQVLFAREGGLSVAVTVVAPDLTDPQTAITGDPRGTYTPVGAPNGVLDYELNMIGNPAVNAAGNGGLHGLRHFV